MIWGDLHSQFRYFGMYRSLATHRWSTVLQLFESSAHILAADPANTITSPQQEHGLRASFSLLRGRPGALAQLSDDELLYRLRVRWHLGKLDEAAFRLFYEEQGLSPFRAALEVEPDALDELRDLHARHGAVLFTGPHLGSYGAGIPILVELLRLREPAAYYQLDSQTQAAMTALLARSSMPANIKPELVDQREPGAHMVRLLEAGRSVFMLSDSTGIGRRKGSFKGQMLGRLFHAPTGPFRVAAAAAVPLACAAVTRGADHSFRLHLDLLWAPEREGPVHLSEAQLGELVARKWALFESYFEHDPLSWEGLEFWSEQPEVQAPTP